jgi:hypothetical protein
MTESSLLEVERAQILGSAQVLLRMALMVLDAGFSL